MIRSNRSADAMARMRAADPFPLEEVRKTVAPEDLERAMRRAIVDGDSPARPIPAGDRVAMERGAGGGPGRVGIFSRHRVATAGFGLACAAVAAALIVLGGGSVDSVRPGGHPTYAAAAVKVAEANPRLLVTAPGWSIIHADSFEVESGGLTYRYKNEPAYGPAGRRLTEAWHSARDYPLIMRELGRDATAEPSTVLGRRATTFHANGGRTDLTVLPPQGAVFVEISASPSDSATVLRSLRAVSVDRWLAAMPPEVVQPTSRSSVIAAMLDSVPLPPGFDLAALETESHLTSRFELGRSVADAVACGWLESWSAAKRSGDDATAQQAVEGMSGARRWPVLLQMVREKGFHGDALPAHGNGWPSNVVAAGNEIAHGYLRREPAVVTTYRNGTIVSVMTPKNAAPASVLGCHLGGG
jgi:hypothetical protein